MLFNLLLRVALRDEFVIVGVKNAYRPIPQVEHQSLKTQNGGSVMRFSLFIKVVAYEDVHRHINENQHQNGYHSVNRPAKADQIVRNGSGDTHHQKKSSRRYAFC